MFAHNTVSREEIRRNSYGDGGGVLRSGRGLVSSWGHLLRFLGSPTNFYFVFCCVKSCCHTDINIILSFSGSDNWMTKSHNEWKYLTHEFPFLSSFFLSSLNLFTSPMMRSFFLFPPPFIFSSSFFAGSLNSFTNPVSPSSFCSFFHFSFSISHILTFFCLFQKKLSFFLFFFLFQSNILDCCFRFLLSVIFFHNLEENTGMTAVHSQIQLSWAIWLDFSRKNSSASHFTRCHVPHRLVQAHFYAFIFVSRISFFRFMSSCNNYETRTDEEAKLWPFI